MEKWIQDLRILLEKADFDQALAFVDGMRPEDLEQKLTSLRTDPLATLDARCLICEVHDYAGQKEKGFECIKDIGLKAKNDLTVALRESSSGLKLSTDQLQYLTLQSWACIHFGMVGFYRKQLYKESKELFTLAKDLLELINQELPCLHALSRAHYCLGLVAREVHRYYDAREHFSRSVEFAELSLKQKHALGQPVAILQYDIGRALGLGMAWLAYSRASMWEANAHIVAARLLLQDKGVKYIRAYVDIVHACTQRSRANDIEHINEAVRLMEHALTELGGERVLQDRSGGHIVYAFRATSELARAHLCAARIYAASGKKRDKKQHLKKALSYLKLIRSSMPNAASGNTSRLPISDKRTYCNGLITASRILRELGKYRAALKAAEKATEFGTEGRFSRIDCWIALGEGHYHCGDYPKALEQFRNARDDKRAQTNPKVVAVCDLHLARCHLALGEVDRAQEILAIWKTSGFIGRDNAFVRNLADELEQRLTHERAPFSIPGNADLAADWFVELRYWLASTALKRVNGRREEAAKEIRKSVKTLTNWLEKK